MLRILSFEKQPTGTALLVECDEFMPGENVSSIKYFLANGILETYLDQYGFPAGASLTALLVDGFYDDVEMPHWENDFEDEFKRIVALGLERIEWQCDKNELLAAVTIDEDDAEQVAGTWVAIRNENEKRAASFQKYREEQLAAEFIDSLPVAIRTQPRNTESTVPADAPVGLAIQFVP